jgi:hypothetical protein
LSSLIGWFFSILLDRQGSEAQEANRFLGQIAGDFAVGMVTAALRFSCSFWFYEPFSHRSGVLGITSLPIRAYLPPESGHHITGITAHEDFHLPSQRGMDSLA